VLATNLDGDPAAIPQCREHVDALRETFADDPKILWDGYRIVADIIVCVIILSISLMSAHSLLLAFHCSLSPG
jgi:hypothetical protein